MSKRKYDDDYLTKETIRFYLETQKPADPFDEHGNFDPSKLDRFTPYAKRVKSYFDDLGNYYVRNFYAFIFAVSVGGLIPEIRFIAIPIYYICCCVITPSMEPKKTPGQHIKTFLWATLILGIGIGLMELFYLLSTWTKLFPYFSTLQSLSF